VTDGVCEAFTESGDVCGDPGERRRDPQTGMTLTRCPDHWEEIDAEADPRAGHGVGLLGRVGAALRRVVSS